MHGARLNGATIRYADEGDRGGAPVLFVNSLGTDLRVWDKVVALLPDGLRIIRADKRGHGLSELTPGPYTIEGLADDAAALLDRLEVTGAAVVGLSIGGMIAQSLAARRPELVRGMVLMDTAAKIGTPEIWEDRLGQVEAGGIEAIADAVMQRWFAEGFRSGHAEEAAIWRTMLTRTPAAGYVACGRAIAAADLTEATRRLALPTLAMAGSEDGSTPPDLVAATAKLIPGARMEVIEGSGHLPCVDRPAMTAALITGFLQDLNLVD